MAGTRVLILVREILGASLIGALVEGRGHEAVFPIVAERAELSISRTRPAAVVVEGHHPATRSDAFFSTAAGLGCAVILFVPGPPWEDIVRIARERDVAAFVHPEPGESLADLLAAALGRVG